MWTLMLGLALAEDCPEPTTTAQVQRALEDAQVAFTQLEMAQFKEHVAAARAAVPCLGDTMPRYLSAELHRFVGLEGEVDEDKIRASQAFAAARAIAPDYAFPAEMVPPDSPVMADYESIPVAASPTKKVPRPATGVLQFDGRPGQERPSAWPTVMQLLDDSGGVVTTAYVWPEEDLPPYETRGKPVERSTKHRLPLLVTTGALAVGSGALLGVAWQRRGVYDDPATSDDRLDGLRASTNTLSLASGATAVLAAGAGVAVAVTW